jgi:HSP20 family protein
MNTPIKKSASRIKGADRPLASRWSPLREMERMQRQLDALLETQLGNGRIKEALSAAEWSPSVDVTEDDNEYVINAELPEVKKEDVKVDVKDGVLTLSGERKLEKEEKGKKYRRVERAYGSFERLFTLPDDADATKITAEFKDGMLKVHLPKNPAATPKNVIKVN